MWVHPRARQQNNNNILQKQMLEIVSKTIRNFTEILKLNCLFTSLPSDKGGGNMAIYLEFILKIVFQEVQNKMCLHPAAKQ